MSLAEFPQVQALSAREKLELVDELWKSITTSDDSEDVSAEVAGLLDARWEKFLQDPSTALSVEDFKVRMSAVRS